MEDEPPPGGSSCGEFQMQIYSAARLEKDYSAVAAQCARTGEAQILAENGRADLVVMDAKTYQRLAEKATGTGSKSLASDRIALEMGVVAAG
ncbi:type II toxin-antitoxin system Phd/YefM family antitoxin [Sutterella seckii]|uniref:Type II toxin-antitoxin system Phd/YefM family antitoxin n=2 Tax=Sutterella seckii TaxID=1944635 RepID=A0A6I1EGR6_9BURK|nr:type II toxin-antitoxin system Phd/YefM family antitoxin [Sutterella seckii]